MERNSIKSNLNKDDIISDIILSMGADIKNLNVYVLVEGEDDIKLLRSFLSDNVLLYESCDGKNSVEYIVGVHFADNERVIGIRDRDYKLKSSMEKIFFYDYCCMEMMLIASESVFDKLCDEYYNGILNYRNLKELIFKQLKFLSIIRKYNEREGLGIKFKGISINMAWNADLKKLNQETIIDKINGINNGILDEFILHKLKSEFMRTWTLNEYYLYTQGHDYFMLFSAICNHYTRNNVRYTDIQSSARCSFRYEDFVKTYLYNNVKAYSQKRNITIFSILEE